MLQDLYEQRRGPAGLRAEALPALTAPALLWMLLGQQGVNFPPVLCMEADRSACPVPAQTLILRPKARSRKETLSAAQANRSLGSRNA